MPEDPNLAARLRMVNQQVRARGITDARVLEAMTAVPRERFVRACDFDDAFADRALPIECDQTISQPYIVAAMTDALEVRNTHKVLEIGTGSGYQAAVLAYLGQHIYTVERVAPLLEQARQRLDALGVRNVSYRVADGTMGWPEFAPYDRIMVTASAPEVPSSLVDQLADGGRLVIPVGPTEQQILVIVDRHGRSLTETRRLPCCFVKLLGQEGWPEDA